MTLDRRKSLIRSRNKFSKSFLYSSFILIGIINTFLGPILPLISEKWQINDIQAGYFLAAQSLGGMIGTLITSFLFAKFSSRQILATGYILFIVSLFGLGGNLWETGLFSSFLSGLGLGVTIPTTTLIISKIAGESRAAAINLLNFFWAAGAVLSPLIFFGLSSQNQLKYVFVPLVCVCAAFLFFLPKMKNLRIAGGGKSTAGDGKKSAALFSVWLFVITIFLQIGIEASLSGWLPTFAKRITSSDLWLIVPAIYWFGFLSSRLFSTFYLRRISEKSAILSGLILVITGQILVLLTLSINLAAFGAFLVGFGSAPIFPITIAILSGKFEKKAPELISYMFLLAGLSGMIFSWLIGYAASLTGELKMALLIPLLCGATLFLLHLIFNKTSSDQADIPAKDRYRT